MIVLPNKHFIEFLQILKIIHKKLREIQVKQKFKSKYV